MKKKYVKDYRVEESLTESGRVESRAVYIGEWFTFVKSGRPLRELRRKVFVLSALSDVGALVLLGWTTAVNNAWYVMLPLVLSLIPLLILSLGTVNLLEAKGPMTRKQRDTIENRIIPGALFSAALSAAASVSCLVHLFREGLSLSAFGYFLLQAAVCGMTAALFLSRSELETKASEQKGEGSEYTI